MKSEEKGKSMEKTRKVERRNLKNKSKEYICKNEEEGVGECESSKEKEKCA